MFSRKRWIKSNHIHEVPIELPIQFSSTSSWNFFRKLSSKTVKGFIEFNKNSYHSDHGLFVIDMLMTIPNICKQRVHIIYLMMNIIFSFDTGGAISRYESLCNRYCVILTNAIYDYILLQRMKLTSSIFIKTFAKGRGDDYANFYRQLCDIIDFLIANPNMILRKNKTFTGLLNDARRWEEEIAIKENTELSQVTWRKSLKNTQIGKYEIKELNTGLDVYREGKDMHHCVQTYIKLAQYNQYKIFSISKPKNRKKTQFFDAERATLGVYFNTDNNTWQLEQVRGVCNEDVSDAIYDVSNDIITRLNKMAETALNGSNQR